MIGAPLLALLVALSAHPRWDSLSEQERDAHLTQLEKASLRQRLAKVSAGFLGTPYVHSPLGEGEGVDPDPPIRYDAVDCLTFVEETLALSLARKPGEVPTLLQQIRYGTDETYEGRNHLMEAEWLPFNEAKGFIKDVTRELGGEDAVQTQKILYRGAWKTPSSVALALPKDRQITGRFPFWMLPLDKVAAHATELPTGTIMMVVRQDLSWKVTRITHLGFIIRRGGKIYVRHANREPTFQVRDEPLDHFLMRNARLERWKVEGVALFQVLPRGAGGVQSARATP